MRVTIVVVITMYMKPTLCPSIALGRKEGLFAFSVGDFGVKKQKQVVHANLVCTNSQAISKSIAIVCVMVFKAMLQSYRIGSSQ